MPDENNPYPPPDPAPGGPYYQPSQPPPPPHWPPPPVNSYNPYNQPYVRSAVNGTLILILGILGLTICGICAPIAWIMGNQAIATLNQYGDPLNERGLVNGGRICGIIGSIFVGLVLMFYVIMIAIGVLGAGTSAPSRF